MGPEDPLVPVATWVRGMVQGHCVARRNCSVYKRLGDKNLWSVQVREEQRA